MAGSASAIRFSFDLTCIFGRLSWFAARGYKWEGRNQRNNNKKKRLLEMNDPSRVRRELGFGCPRLPPRLAGGRGVSEGTELGRKASAPVPPHPPTSWAPTPAELSPSAPLAERKIGGDLKAPFSGSILTRRRNAVRTAPESALQPQVVTSYFTPHFMVSPTWETWFKSNASNGAKSGLFLFFCGRKGSNLPLDELLLHSGHSDPGRMSPVA